MADSPPGKRERLTAAATDVLAAQGVEKTTIADIATAADVPVGNVYYYFKTKDELVGAAIATHDAHAEALIAGFATRRSPKARLKAMLGEWADCAGTLAAHGCPVGGLCQELNRAPENALGLQARVPLQRMLDWAEAQFAEIGVPDPHGHALTYLGAYQGAALLSATFGDPEILRDELRRLERWVDGQAAGSNRAGRSGRASQ